MSLLLFSSGKTIYSEEKIPSVAAVIYFYNPESNINNYASLKAMFDKYFSHFGNYRFQPFNQKEVFEEILGKRDLQSVLLVVSSWHYRNITKKKQLEPILIATKNGRVTFKKVLIARKPIKNIDNLLGKTVASAGSKEYTLSLIEEMLGEDQKPLLEKIRILNVPKDIDALMSVGFGVAHAAITTEESLEQIKKINPRLGMKLNTLVVSKEILMPIVAAEKGGDKDEEIKRFIEILKNMSGEESGRKKMALLSLDGWSAIPNYANEILNQ